MVESLCSPCPGNSSNPEHLQYFYMTHSFTSSFLLKDTHSRIFLSQIMFMFSDNQTEGEERMGSIGPRASRLCTMCSFYVPTAVPPSRAHPHLPDSWNGNRHLGRHQKKRPGSKESPLRVFRSPCTPGPPQPPGSAPGDGGILNEDPWAIPTVPQMVTGSAADAEGSGFSREEMWPWRGTG